MNGQLKGIDLLSFLRKIKRSSLLIVFYVCIIQFAFSCKSYDNKVKYFSKDIPVKKVDRTITISVTRDYKNIISGEYSLLPSGNYGFVNKTEKNYISDFVIEYVNNSGCDELFPTLTYFSLGVIPNYRSCKGNHTITSYYKQQKRKEYIYNMGNSTFIHLFVFWGLFLNNKEHEEEFSVFKKIALTNIHNDFSSIQEEEEKNKKLKEEESKQAIAEIAKSQKIKVDDILDLRDEKTRDEFLLAWYNYKENPEIENYINYSENEFNFQEDKKKFQNYRKYKYVITDTYWIWGEYDFEKKAYSISSTNQDFVKSLNVKGDFTGTVTRLLEMKKSLDDFDTIKSSVLLSIPLDKAEKFKGETYDPDNVIILSKFLPMSFATTGKCKYPDEYYAIRDDEYKDCKKRFENRQIKFKYLASEPLKYRIVYDGEIYKNY